MDSDSPSDTITSQGGEGGRCQAITRAGKPCPNKLGAGKTLCMAHAPRQARREPDGGSSGGEDPLGQAVGASGRVDVRDTVREALVEIDPKALKAYIQKAVLEGRDVRAITTLLDRVYGDEAVHVEVPHTFDELAKLDREQRRTLMRQLERDGFGPFTAPTH